MSLENRTAVITGATGGLGSTVTRKLAEFKMNLALLDINPDRLETLVKSLSLPASRLFAKSVNLLDLADTVSTAQSVDSKLGRVDVLLHLVGGWTGGKALVDTPTEDLAFMVNQHIWISFNVVKSFVPYMVKNGWGRIVMITSPYAASPNAKGGPYAIGKAGEEALMLALSQELKGTGVTANMLQAKTIDVKREKLSNPLPENASWTTLEELTASILYLLSDEAGTINGARIPMYGSY